MGPFSQGATTGGTGAAQEVEGRGGALLAEWARARPWGGRTAEGAACAIEGAGPRRGRAVQAAVAVWLQVERGAW